MHSNLRLTLSTRSLSMIALGLAFSGIAMADGSVLVDTATTKTTDTPAVAAKADTPPAPPAVTYSGALDLYYGYNFNKPKITNGVASTGPGQRNFDYKDNLFSLGLAELSISKATTTTSRFGFTIKLAYGPTEDLLTSSGDVDNKNVLQAYGTYLVPFGTKDITLDAGKFVTEMGYEVIEPGLNANYSRGLLFQYFIPYYHAGVRAAVPLTNTVTGNLYVYNGWNNVSTDSNPNKAYGLGLTYGPNANTSVTFNGLTSREPAGVGDHEKTTLEVIGTQTFTSAFSGALDVNYDFGKTGVSATSDSKWSSYGVAGYLKYGFKSGSYVALRGEYAKDKDGFLFGTGTDTHASEVTLTYSWQSALFPNSEVRFEYRHDDSNANLFLGNGTGETKTKQDTLTISHILKF